MSGPAPVNANSQAKAKKPALPSLSNLSPGFNENMLRGSTDDYAINQPVPSSFASYAAHCHHCSSIFVISNTCSNCNHKQCNKCL